MSQLYTADGRLLRERITQDVPAPLMHAMAVLGMYATEAGIGLHCTICQGDLSGRNGDEDAVWRVECECRTRVGRNAVKGRA